MKGNNQAQYERRSCRYDVHGETQIPSRAKVKRGVVEEVEKGLDEREMWEDDKHMPEYHGDYDFLGERIVPLKEET